ncbi:PilZ domain-containing protein [Guyparkeria hydrothermalis]|uniref:flagellar brake protein n=1 Tax=Guyparkeria hydrothermalis TaxID=923 RepID=UPI0020210022|nr:PilZ domain-containing protein [Guyparkeria hydrothermalis]MCL7745169.1 PilZ domain-containing protein [Guyparkeria hydrothermalis]
MDSESLVLDDQDIKIIRAPRAIQRALASLFESRAHAWLIPDDDPDFQGQVQVVGNDVDTGRLVFDCPDPVVLRHVRAAGEVRVQAVIDGLLSWFYTSDVKADRDGDDCYLGIGYPEKMKRLQRRSAFRIDLPPDVPGTLAFCLPERREVASGEVVNISATGCAVSFTQKNDPRFALGDEVNAARLKVGEQIDARLEFVVRNRRPGVGSSVVYGLEFNALPPLESQAIDRAVMRLQRLRLTRG